jgi:flagellar basal body P-ring protein FlgI
MTDTESRQLGGIDWLAIQTEFVSGKEYAELSQIYNVKEATIRQRAKRGDWSQIRHSASQAVTEKAIDSIIEVKADLLAKLNETDLSAAQAIRDKANELLGTVTSAQELKALSGTFDIAQKISRLALGASTENSSVTTKELPASVDEFV